MISSTKVVETSSARYIILRSLAVKGVEIVLNVGHSLSLQHNLSFVDVDLVERFFTREGVSVPQQNWF